MTDEPPSRSRAEPVQPPAERPAAATAPGEELDREHADQFRRIVVRKSVRRARARRRPPGTIWSWMGTFGLVGWTVAVPTLLGIAFGAFLDGRTSGSISFTITFLVVGAAVGVTMAWYWVRRESEGDDGP